MALLQKIVRQKKPHNVYETYGDCPPDMWEVEVITEDITTYRRVCSELNPEICPKLGGALVGFAWENKPNIVCTYDLSAIHTESQVDEYLRIWGPDKDFSESIAPILVKEVTTNCPDDISGAPHPRCSKLIEISPLGDTLRDWASRNPSYAKDAIIDYCKETGNPDCDCLQREIDPLFWHMSHRPILRKVDPIIWYFPCRMCSSYLTLDGRLERPGPKNPKVCKRVAAAANEIASVFNNPKGILRRAEEITGCVCEFKTVRKHRKNAIRTLMAEYPVPETSGILNGQEPPGRFGGPRKRHRLFSSLGVRKSHIPGTNKPKLASSGRRKAAPGTLECQKKERGCETETAYNKGWVITGVAAIVIVVLFIFVLFLVINQSSGSQSGNSDGPSQGRAVYLQ